MAGVVRLAWEGRFGTERFAGAVDGVVPGGVGLPLGTGALETPGASV
jgi:hypothetical protein